MPTPLPSPKDASALPLISPFWLEPSIHSSYLKLLLRYCNLPADYVTQKLGPVSRLHSYLELANIYREVGIKIDLQTAMDFGFNTALSAHGLVGQAAIASEHLFQAFTVIARYKPTRNNVLSYQWQAVNGGAQFTIRTRFDLLEFREFSLAAALFTQLDAVAFLTGKKAMAELRLGLPSAFSAFSQRSIVSSQQIQLSPNEDEVTLFVPEPLLYRSNVLADTRHFELACQGCEEELRLLQGRLTERAKRLIVNVSYRSSNQTPIMHWRSLTQLAEAMTMSTRTLNRRLQSEGTSYSAILDQTRCQLACWYLTNSELSIASLADLLGFEDSTNFSRTFRRWQQVTPSHYREQCE